MLPVVAIAGLSGMVLSRERVVAGADARMIDGGLALARNDLDRVRLIGGAMVPPGAPARAQLSDAMLLLQTASSLPASRRAAAIDAALTRVDIALARRPRWGDALAVKAYLEEARSGGASRAAMAAFAGSYAAAPYLPSAAEWRIRYGATRWAALSPAARRNVLDEALWLATVDGGKRGEMFGWFRATPAYRPLMLRWRAMRRAVWSRGA